MQSSNVWNAKFTRQCEWKLIHKHNNFPNKRQPKVLLIATRPSGSVWLRRLLAENRSIRNIKFKNVKSYFSEIRTFLFQLFAKTEKHVLQNCTSDSYQ